jgi:methylated-DNA-[protein]-cysteine S-methyltransferase
VRPASFALFDTPIGRCGVAWTERGIASVQLPEADDAATRAKLLARHPGAEERPPRGEAKRAVDAMRAHLEGRLDPLDSFELDDHGLPDFHRRVYRALRKVGPGKTVGYGELAALVGSPGAARAVGQAVGKNPFPILVPCQRVLAAGGRPGGFSAHGGVETKRRMLAIEGVTLGGAPERPAAIVDPDAVVAHLTGRDARLGRIIAQVGPPRIRLTETQSTFEALAESIVYQQLTGKAAATIHGRLRALFPRKRLKPEALLAQKDEALRGAGLSRGKALALRDLAHKTLDGTVPSVRALHALDDDAIVERLVQVRGIGRWTVEMLLIFRLGRPDVLPVGDYGVRHGFKLAYGKREMPTPKDLERHGERWRPFRSAASWYLWRAVDLARKKAPEGRA